MVQLGGLVGWTRLVTWASLFGRSFLAVLLLVFVVGMDGWYG